MRFWKIEGYDGLTKIYERELKTGCFSEKEIAGILIAVFGFGYKAPKMVGLE